MSVHRQELTPLHFLERAGEAYAEHVAVEDGALRFTWRELRARARRLASALQKLGIQKGERVALLGFNQEPLLLAHFGVPLAGAVLVAINTRLNAAEVAYIVAHSGARAVFVAPELAPLLAQVPPTVQRFDLARDWEDFLETGSDAPLEVPVADENEPITINYTSGTTGKPKGVVYHHRGAYLNALAMALDHKLTSDSRYLWTLPMFHCNGWCFPWATVAVGARNVCIPRIEPAQVWQLFDEGVTHFCAAPTVCTMLAAHPSAKRLTRKVRLFTAGAPPSPTLIARMAELNFELDHVYGLTEVYGPAVVCEWHDEWNGLSADEQAVLKARQGVAYPVLEGLMVANPTTLEPVPSDGRTIGEVFMRGNIVMKGYLKNPKATREAFEGGWFHSGDIAVMHADGYIEIRDRKKDIVISGGENISSIEVEKVLAEHPAVLEAAVVAAPDEKWGEVPKAYVGLKAGQQATADELIEFCRGRLAHFKCPKYVEFGPLPRTATGKIRKNELRARRQAQA